MRPADIYRLHYESAFARLNPGKPLVLPPNGIVSRVLPAPSAASTPDITAAVRQATSSNAYAPARPAPEGNLCEEVHQQAAETPIVVEVAEPISSAPIMMRRARDANQRTYGSAERAGAATIQDAVSVDAYDVRTDATASIVQSSTSNPASNSSIPPRARRFRFDRQSNLVAGALALGIGATSLFFAHPDPQAMSLAWHTYKAAKAGRSDRGGIASRATVDEAPHRTVAPDTLTSNPNGSTQPNSVTPADALRSAASKPAGFTIPHAPAVAPHALTSQDLLPNQQGNSPLGNVSPDALRRSTGFSVQNVTVDPTTMALAPANVYASPIRKPLTALHHSAESSSDVEPVQARPAHASVEAVPKKNAGPTAVDVATPAISKAPARPAQQAPQDTNGDQKLF